MLRQAAFAIVPLLAVPGLALAQQKVMLETAADVGVSSVRTNLLESNSTAPSTAIRQNQNWSGFETKALLMQFKAEPIKGWKIQEAWLHLYVAKEDLYCVGLCEVLAPWAEQGRAGRRRQQAAAGGPSWLFARTPKDTENPEAASWWAWPGSNLPSVSWAHPMARYSHAGPADIKKENVGYPGESGDLKPFVHLRIPVKVELVAGMAAGTNYGVVVTDDKGQVAESYSLIGPGYPYAYNQAADPWVFTKEIQDESLRPKLEVIGSPAENEGTPDAPKDLKVVKVEPSTSTVTLEMTAPAGQVLAYEVVCTPGQTDDWSQAEALPRWEIPLPAKPGAPQRMPIWTLPPGEYTVGVRSVSMVGYRSQFASVKVTVPQVPEAQLAEVEAPDQDAGEAAGQGDRTTQVYVVPDMVKVDPVSGAVLKAGDVYQVIPGYALRNPVWNAENRRVSLPSAANETVAFQVIVRKTDKDLKNVRVKVGDLAGPAGTIAADPNAQAFRVWYVESVRDAKAPVGPNEEEITDVTVRPVAWHGDAAVPMTEEFSPTVDVPAASNGIDGQTNQAIWVDLYVPKGTKAGDYVGKVAVEGDGLAAVQMDIALKVLPLSLPDKSSWIVELNSYGGLAGYAGVDGRDVEWARQAEYSFYRLAKQHRQMVNALPYKQSGRLDPAAPPVEVKDGKIQVTDWSPFDDHYGPLLDGSAFTAKEGYIGPDAGAGISEMYLHFHENWPLPLDKWYQDYKPMKTRLDFAAWAKTSRVLDKAFSDEYKRHYADVARQFAEHFQQKGWTDTVYHVFLNNKYYFKVPYFASQLTTAGNGTSFWLLDEPVDYDDYMANEFFLGLARQGADSAKAPDVKFAYRTDVSQPEMTRGMWDNVCNLWVCSGGAIRSGYVLTANVRQKWIPDEEFWHYGGGPGLSAAPVDAVESFLNSWCSGSTGMLPYWTTNGGNRWTRPSDPNLAIYYTGRNYANSGKNHPGAFASLRIKTMRRAQQDLEYLHLLAAQKGWDRALVRQAIAAYADDPAAPVLNFGNLSAEKEVELRQAVVATILRNGAGTAE